MTYETFALVYPADMTAAGFKHLESIRVWQRANGGFRRAPPKSYNPRLASWIGNCRREARAGTLNPAYDAALRALGLSLDTAQHGRQPSSQLYEACIRAMARICPGGEVEDMGPRAAWRTDRDTIVWIGTVRELAQRDPASPLIEDLKRMIPVFFAEQLAPGTVPQPAPPRRSCMTPTGQRHLDTIRTWQQANGGFRRLPPRGYNQTLTNWVNQCRTDYRKGTLSPDTATALRDLGIQLDAALNGLQPGPMVYEACLRAIQVIRGGGGAEDMSPHASWRFDADVLAWRGQMRELAARRPDSPLIEDLQRMLPAFHAEQLEPVRGTNTQAPALKRGTDAMLEGIIAFHGEHQRLPSFLAEDKHERQLASWLIRWEHGLMGRRALSAKREAEQRILGQTVNTLLDGADTSARRAQWHWWSLCASSTLQDPSVGNAWHGQLISPAPASWANKLKRDPHDRWLEQTERDAVANKIEEPWRMALAIEAALESASREHAAFMAATHPNQGATATAQA